LVTDDCSTDKTFLKLEEFAEVDPRIRIFKNPKNFGAAAARNMSIKNSKSRFLAFLDADDLWFPEKIKLQISFMKEEKCPISFTPFVLAGEAGERQTDRVWDLSAPSRLDHEGLLKKMATFGCSTVMVDLDKTGEFKMPNLRTGQDYATWLMLLRRGNIACKYPEPLSTYRLVGQSLSRNKIKKAARQWQIYRELEKLGFRESSYYFVNYAFRAIFRP